ncbi:MAG: molybdopterin synthase catalytic subunit MoaE [Oleibacter sp.]|nr:molybdopterin synthase catalytic subunit MoaE [Thalassolituus sp.]
MEASTSGQIDAEQTFDKEVATNIRVQTEDFDVGQQHRWLSNNSPSTGAVVCFTGLVREFSEREGVLGLVLEHYPGMTQRALQSIVEEARQRWPLQRVSVIHRIGQLLTQDNIVLVGVSSAHRDSAFDAAKFIMDALKTRAPFWKKELTKEGSFWVDARASDQLAAAQWQD